MKIYRLAMGLLDASPSAVVLVLEITIARVVRLLLALHVGGRIDVCRRLSIHQRAGRSAVAVNFALNLL